MKRREILNQLRLEKIEVEEKACKNFANRHVECNDCERACPTNAIQMEQNIPVINQGNCIDCGICVSTCTVYAIDHIQNPYMEIGKAIDTHPTASITCKQLEEYQKGIKIPCYLYLDLPLLMKFKNNEIKIYLKPCETCEKNEVIDVELHINRLQQELDKLNIALKLKIEREKTMKEDDPVVKGITRRELLKIFSIKNIREIITEEKEEVQEISVLTGKDKILFKRNIMNQYFNQQDNDRQNKISLPFNQFLKIDPIDQCRGCDICQRICPTGAIKWINDQNNAILQFDTHACIACKKCAVCPDQVIQFQPIDMKEYLTVQNKTLIKLNLKQCNECGETFKTNLEIEVCEFCDAAKQKDPSRFFA